MGVRKLEENIKGCPRGNFCSRGHELVFVRSGIRGSDS